MRSIYRLRIIVAILIAASALASGCTQKMTPDPAVDPVNELPIGTVDDPVNGAKVPQWVRFAGWAVDDQGIRELRFFVDGHFQTVEHLAFDRPDVSKALPLYAKRGDKHGWAVGLALEPAGQHTVVVQAIDTNGASRDIGVLTLTSLPK